MAKKSRFDLFSFGTITHKTKEVKVMSTSKKWQHVSSMYTYNLSKVPNGMGGRPDLISQKAYQTPEYWWLICAVNDISDPFEQLIPGKLIKLPII